MGKDRIICSLIGALVGGVLLWLTFATTTVSRAAMQQYVKDTASSQLDVLREDMRAGFLEVSKRIAAVERILRERH